MKILNIAMANKENRTEIHAIKSRSKGERIMKTVKEQCIVCKVKLNAGYKDLTSNKNANNSYALEGENKCVCGFCNRFEVSARLLGKDNLINVHTGGGEVKGFDRYAANAEISTARIVEIIKYFKPLAEAKGDKMRGG